MYKFGIGNNLLDNVKSISRILCPEKNAYDKYDEILKSCIKKNEDVLFLLCLGSTVTVLAKELNDIDFQVIDIEYEWFLRKAQKCKVANKHFNEANDVITGYNDKFEDLDYEKSAITRIL